jgi:hypothetical protein
MFKNLSRVISPSVFSKPNAFLLQHKHQVLNPAAQFFNPDRSPTDYHPFESALLALSFSNKKQRLGPLLEQAGDQAHFRNFINEVILGSSLKSNSSLMKK